MIKLIVSDLDGTLLNDSKDLPQEFDSLLSELHDKGIIFSTASGRNYLTQEDVFGTRVGKMSFICDNGAYIREDGKVSRVSIIKPESWKSIVANVYSELNDAVCVLCGRKGAYSVDFSQYPEITEIMDTIYTGIIYKDSFEEIDDDIFKISVCCPNGSRSKLYPLLSRVCPSDVNAIITHPSFMDVMNKGMSKGTAIEYLQDKYGISHEETMVFGDYYNDVDMLSKGKFSYIMANAPEDMKVYAKYTAPDNNSGGVVTVIKDYLKSLA